MLVEWLILTKRGEPDLDHRIMDYRAQYWREIVTECNTSGMRKNEWLRLHDISPKIFYRWQKKLRDLAIEEHETGIKENDSTDLTAVSQNRVPVMVDMTQMLSRSSETLARQSDPAAMTSKQIAPELMIQAGQYTLYVGSGITESTLSIVLRVIGRA